MSGRFTKYRIHFHQDDAYSPWWLFLPGSVSAVGKFRTRERAVAVMDAHADGADCPFFLRGLCGCRFECAR